MRNGFLKDENAFGSKIEAGERKSAFYIDGDHAPVHARNCAKATDVPHMCKPYVVIEGEHLKSNLLHPDSQPAPSRCRHAPPPTAKPGDVARFLDLS